MNSIPRCMDSGAWTGCCLMWECMFNVERTYAYWLVFFVHLMHVPIIGGLLAADDVYFGRLSMCTTGLTAYYTVLRAAA